MGPTTYRLSQLYPCMLGLAQGAGLLFRAAMAVAYFLGMHPSMRPTTGPPRPRAARDAASAVPTPARLPAFQSGRCSRRARHCIALAAASRTRPRGRVTRERASLRRSLRSRAGLVMQACHQGADRRSGSSGCSYCNFPRDISDE